MPTVREWLQQNRDQYTDRTKWMKDCSKTLHITLRAAQKKASVIWPVAGKPTTKVSACRPDALNRASFLAKYDDATRIRNAINKGVLTLAGQKSEEDEILEEPKFRQDRCDSVNPVGFRPIAQDPEFAKFQFRVQDKIFWTTPRTREWALQNVAKAQEV